MSCYVDGVFSDTIDQSISAKQSEQLGIICALCGSVYQISGTVYFMEWSHGVESWSGVIEWSLGGKCWSGSVGLNSNKPSPYFIT